MNTKPHIAIFASVCISFCAIPAFSFHSGFTDATGETIFSMKFRDDYASATKALHDSKSIQPLLQLLEKYKGPEEQAELEVTIGLTYNQHGGFIDYGKAVIHFSNALKYRLPEKTYIAVLMWRGNSLEILKKHNEALKDYLRGLLACSYHDLSGGWPAIKSSNVSFNRRSEDPNDVQRARDYQRSRRRIDFQWFLLRQRYYFVEATKRVLLYLSLSDDQVLNTLKEISPDTSRYTLIMNLLRSENKEPWP